MKYGVFDLISYDLIGEEDGGYSVNDAWLSIEDITISEDASDKEILKHLKSIGYLRNHLQYSRFDSDGEFKYTIYFNYNGYPAFELRCKEILDEKETKNISCGISS